MKICRTLRYIRITESGKISQISWAPSYILPFLPSVVKGSLDEEYTQGTHVDVYITVGTHGDGPVYDA
jgi:hypothetical protein